MAIQISRREVLDNLIRFNESILGGGRSALHARDYTAYVNRHTGDIRFVEPRIVRTAQDDWIEIHFVAEDGGGKVHFHLKEPKAKGLDPLANRILAEMLAVLNQLAALYMLASERELAQHLSDVEVSLSEPIENMLGWAGSLSRIEAEKRLIGYPPGTYLFRYGDAITESVADAMEEVNKMKVKVYVMTFVEPMEKISDQLLLQTEKGWTICQDESDLASPLYKYYSNLSALLISLSDIITTPI